MMEDVRGFVATAYRCCSSLLPLVDLIEQRLIVLGESQAAAVWPVRVVTGELFVSFRVLFFVTVLSLLSLVLKLLESSLFLLQEFIECFLYFSKPINPLYSFLICGMIIAILIRYQTQGRVLGVLLSFLVRCSQVCSIPPTVLDIVIFGFCMYLSMVKKHESTSWTVLGVFHLSRLPVIVGIGFLESLLSLCGFIFQYPTLILIIMLFFKSVFVVLFHLHFDLVPGQPTEVTLSAGDSSQLTIQWEYPKLSKFAPYKFDTKLKLAQEELITIGNDDNFIHTEYNDEHLITVHYRLTTAGIYTLLIRYGNVPLKTSAITITVKPSDICVEKSSLVVINRKASTTTNQVYDAGRQVELAIRLRDAFDNIIHVSDYQLIKNVYVNVSGLPSDSIAIFPPVKGLSFETSTEDVLKAEELLCVMNFVVEHSQVHHVSVTYNNQSLLRGEFDLVVLNAKSSRKIKADFNTCTKATMISTKEAGTKTKLKKPTKIYIFATPTQVYIKEYFLGWIPMNRHFTWSLNSSLKLNVKQQTVASNSSIIELGNDAEMTELSMELSDAVLLYASITLHLQQKYKASSFEKRKLYARSLLREKQNQKSITDVIDRNFLVRDGCAMLLKLTEGQEIIKVAFQVSTA